MESVNNGFVPNFAKPQGSLIKVIGVGGGGSNAVNYMFGQGIKDVDFMVCNTDIQALYASPVQQKLQLGPSLTSGLGAGAQPEVGKNAAIENLDELKSLIGQNTKMVFITAGMGGGTGTGAAPIVAGLCREMGILTVGIVTLPFNFEGRRRKEQAEKGINELRANVDTLLIISNERLREIYGNLAIKAAFGKADNVLTTAAKGIAEIITSSGLINVDFEDVKTVMQNGGVALMGSSTSSGPSRAITAAEEALASPLLNDNNISGAKRILLNITSSSDADLQMTMDEVTEITEYVQTATGQNADLIWGSGFDDSLGEAISVTIIATGFDNDAHDLPMAKQAEPVKVHTLETQAPKAQAPVAAAPAEDADGYKVIIKEPLQVNEPKTVLSLDDEVSDITFPFAPVNNAVENTPASKVTPEVKAEEPKKMVYDLMGEVKKPVESNHGSGFTPAKEAAKVVENPNQNEFWTPRQVPANEVKPVLPKVETPASSKNSFGMDSDAFASAMAVSKTRIEELKKFNYFSDAQPFEKDKLAELESQPAYKRKNAALIEETSSSQSNVSRFSLSNQQDGKPEIRTKNSFLHDKAD